MGLFSKLKKGLKSIVKKVARGIKKVAKGIGKVMGKIAKPFAKFGILGQIALSFIMPWAIGGLMSGMGFLAGSAFGTTAAGWAGSSNLFVKAAGKLAQGINYGAAAVNKAYTFVSDGITKGLDWVGQQGAKLKQGITNKYDAAKEWVTGTPTYDDALSKELFSGEDIFADTRQTVTDVATGGTKTIMSSGAEGLSPTKAFEKIQTSVSTPVSIADTKLAQHGNKLISGGTAAAKKVFTLDTAKNEIVKAAKAQEPVAQSSSYEEGPTVSYLETPLQKISQDYDFSIKAAGGQYMSPLESAIVLDTYKETMRQYMGEAGA
tara:strand:+ start:481 stop:1437 length:957 start_codon:yes stop_codon:yes gene_type:complete